jgi:hypothetical protein
MSGRSSLKRNKQKGFVKPLDLLKLGEEGKIGEEGKGEREGEEREEAEEPPSEYRDVWLDKPKKKNPRQGEPTDDEVNKMEEDLDDLDGKFIKAMKKVMNSMRDGRKRKKKNIKSGMKRKRRDRKKVEK